jgi:uncharacterized protein (TIGR02266 family)
MLSEDRVDTLSGRNRRGAPRLAVPFDLKVDVTGENTFYTGLLKDISTGGLFISTDHPPPYGSRFHLRFSFPGMEESVECEVQVRWIRDRFTEGNPEPGMGVEFVEMPTALRNRINAFLEGKDVLMFDEGY